MPGGFAKKDWGKAMATQSIRLISWNVASRKSCSDQVKELVAQSPDMVALQEVTPTTAELFRKELAKTPLVRIVDSFQLARKGPSLRGHRKYGKLIASRWDLEGLPPSTDLVWPERLLSVLVKTPRGVMELHTAYIPPGSSNGWKKVEVLEGIFERLSRRAKLARILCGDFNTPKEERTDGQVITWAQTVKRGGNVKLGKRGERWDQAERNVLQGLARFDLCDVFRLLHGYKAQEFSWYVVRKSGRKGRRFDHVFASASLKPVACRYLHTFREKRLSDHSPIEVCFEPGSFLQNGGPT